MTDEPKQLGKCIRCDVPVFSLGAGMSANPDDAMVGVIAGHYGSVHDCSTATIFVCDACVTTAGVELVQQDGWMIFGGGRP